MILLFVSLLPVQRKTLHDDWYQDHADDAGSDHIRCIVCDGAPQRCFPYQNAADRMTGKTQEVGNDHAGIKISEIRKQAGDPVDGKRKQIIENKAKQVCHIHRTSHELYQNRDQTGKHRLLPAQMIAASQQHNGRYTDASAFRHLQKRDKLIGKHIQYRK